MHLHFYRTPDNLKLAFKRPKGQFLLPWPLEAQKSFILYRYRDYKFPVYVLIVISELVGFHA